MRIKYNYIKIQVNQPQRRFNTNSNRQKIADIITSLQADCSLHDVIIKAMTDHDLNVKTVMSVISKMKQTDYITLIEQGNQT